MCITVYWSVSCSADRAEWTDKAWPFTSASLQLTFTTATPKTSHPFLSGFLCFWGSLLHWKECFLPSVDLTNIVLWPAGIHDYIICTHRVEKNYIWLKITRHFCKMLFNLNIVDVQQCELCCLWNYANTMSEFCTVLLSNVILVLYWSFKFRHLLWLLSPI